MASNIKAKATRPRVYARLRPMFGRDAGQPELFTVVDGTSLDYRKEETSDISRFTFDKIFGMDSKQEEVFTTIGEVALSSLRRGFNSTILAYGQTGSGKTFSMEGAKDKDTGRYTQPGLIPRLFEQIFVKFRSDETIKSFEMSLQYIELYNEQLQDLLGKRKVVDVSMDPSGGYQCKDAVRHVCKDALDAQRVYEQGCAMRATASTKMNEASSRSHALLQISVNWTEQKGKSFGVLNLVDLAGSEGLKKSGAEGQNAKEGIKINMSLCKLALTVKCLAEGATHIPFRESKLTMMLAKGLGGSNMLHIILALSNSREQVAEGTACLRFGQSCLSMSVNPSANKLEKEQAEMRAVIAEQLQEIADLQSENENLKLELERAKDKDAAPTEFLIAKYIEVNKEALSDDLKEAAGEIEALQAQLMAKRAERLTLEAEARDGKGDGGALDEAAFAGLSGQDRAEAIEAQRRARALERIKAVAENEQDIRAIETEIEMQAEIERRLQERLKGADGAAAAEAERIRAEVEEEEARKRRELEDRAAALEAQLLAAQRANEEREEERRRREAEAGSSKGALESLQQEARAAIELQQRQETELEVTRSNLEAELEKMRAQLATMAMESDARAAAETPTVRLRERLKGEAGSGMLYEAAEVRISEDR